MTMKRIRCELDALREALSAPAAVSAPSALDDIGSRLERLAVRQHDATGHLTAVQMAELAQWWKQRFGKELCA
jgi:hypothetical protein